MADECNLVKKNLGLGNCPKMPGYFRRMMTTKNNWFIPAATIAAGSAAVKAFIQEAILDPLSTRIYLWPQFFNSSPDGTEETIYQQTPLGKRKVRDGFYEWLIQFSDSMCSHKAMYTHRATNGRVIFIDTDGQLNGTYDEDGNFYGYSIQMLNTEKMTPNTGAEVAMSPVRITLNDNLELDRDGALISVSGLSTLEAIVDALLTIISADDTEIVVDVTVSCDGTPLTGLELADFVLLDSNGDPQTISGVTEVNGRYTLTGTGFETGTLNTAAAEDLSITAYEGTAVPVTIAS